MKHTQFCLEGIASGATALIAGTVSRHGSLLSKGEALGTGACGALAPLMAPATAQHTRIEALSTGKALNLNYDRYGRERSDAFTVTKA